MGNKAVPEILATYRCEGRECVVDAAQPLIESLGDQFGTLYELETNRSRCNRDSDGTPNPQCRGFSMIEKVVKK